MTNPASKEDPQAFAPRVTFTSLNTDILYNVMSYIGSKRTLLALMSMSRGLFSVGLPQLLGRSYRFRDSTTIESFHDFLVFTSPRSFGALRSLDFWPLPSTQTPLVAEILRRASGLKELTVSIESNNLEPVDAVHDAIVSSTSLRELHLVDHPNLTTGRKWAQIQSPLTRLYIVFSVDLGDPISHFSNLRHSLVYMHISDIKLSLANPQPCYPKVVHLELHRCSLDSKPSLSVLMTAFPNLQHLEIDYDMQAHRDPIRDVDRIRQENLEWKAQPGQWKSLQFVSVDKWCFNALALRGKVPSLTIQAPLWFPHTEETPWLQAAFARLEIEGLSLGYIEYSREMMDRLPVLFSTSLDKLARVRLNVLIAPEATETPQQQLDAVLATLKHLKQLRSLTLNLGHVYNAPGIVPIEKFLQQLDMTVLAGRAKAASSTSVTSIELSALGGDVEHRSLWTITGDGEHRRLTKVPSRQ